MTPDGARQCLPTIADLIDELTINQIKQVLAADGARHRERVASLVHDVDLLLGARGAVLDARLVRALVLLAQTNLHIWVLKDRAQQEPARYMEHLKLAHQLNGVRNQMKNLLLDALGDGDPALRRTNDDTDGLAGWGLDPA
jgi:hypothetical protein